MKGRDIIDEILALGLKSQTVYPVEPRAIFASVNRAIEEVNRLCPVIGTVEIAHFPIKPIVYRGGISVHKGGEDMEINASGVRSLAFAVTGSGSVTITANGVCKEITWIDVTSFRTFRVRMDALFGVDEADVVLCFTGAHTYMIKDISIYADTVGDLEEDIVTYSKQVAYDMASAKYAGGRFMDFSSLPIRFNDERQFPQTEFRIDGTVIYIPTDRQGVYGISYYKKPTEIDEDNKDATVDVDERLADLVPLRAAYYFYMVTDRELAERCNAEYLRLQSIVMATMRKIRTPVKFREARSW